MIELYTPVTRVAVKKKKLTFPSQPRSLLTYDLHTHIIFILIEHGVSIPAVDSAAIALCR